MSSRIRRFPIDQEFLADLLSRPLADHDQYKVGTFGNDKIHTGRGNDVVDSGEGNDRISTGRGDDVIDSGEGNDRVYAGRGDDVIESGEGNDRIYAGRGDDIILSGPGNDRVNGGRGFDTVVLEGSLSDYDIHVYAHGKKAVITDLRSGDVDHLLRVESLEFDDAVYDVKHGSVEYKVTLLQVPSSVETNEDSAVTFAAVSDAPEITGGQGGNFSLQIATSDGAVGVPAAGIPSAAEITLTGTAAEINALLQGLQFEPAENYNGTATITYELRDSADDVVADAQQSVAVASVNDAPDALFVGHIIQEDEPYTFSATDFTLIDDSDTPPNNLLAVKITTLPDHGTFTLDGVAVAAGDVISADDINAGKLVFTPEENRVGTTSFTYQVQDDGGTANGGIDLDPTPNSQSFQVQPVNDAPVAVDDSATTAEDTPVNIDVLSNDSDIDSPTLTVTSAAALHGTVVIESNGTITYTPDANFNGDDTITYTIIDGNPFDYRSKTDTATVAVTVTPVDDAPVAVNDAFTGYEDTQITGNVLLDNGFGADYEPDGQQLFVQAGAVQTPNGSGFSVSQDGSFTYTPATGFSGTETVSYTVTDSLLGGKTDHANVTFTVLAEPRALDDSFGSGDADVFIVGSSAVYSAINDGDGNFAVNTLATNDVGREGAAIGDLNGDGSLDVFVVQDGPERAWINDGLGNLTEVHAVTNIADNNNYDVALGDINGDGTLDAVVASPSGGPTRIWLNDGNADFTTGANLSYAGMPATYDIAVGDLNGDGNLDIVEANNGVNRIWINQGGGTFDQAHSIAFGDASNDSRSVTLADLNGDNVLDIFIGNKDGGNTVWINNGDSDNPAFTEISGGLGNAETRAVALGDLNGDGTIDAFVANSGTPGNTNFDNNGAPNEVWFNDGHGNFTLSDNNGVSLGNYTSLDVELADFNGDGALDALVANNVDGQPNLIWLNDGNGNFTSDGTAIGAFAAADVALGDLDGDSALSADGSYALDVLANDVNPNAGGTLSITGITGGDLADALAISADGQSIEFDPSAAAAVQALGADELKTYTFQYTISDGQGGTDTAAAQVTVRGVNDAPVASSVTDPYWAADSHSELDLSGVFSDPEGDTLTYAGNLGAADSWIDIDPNTGVLSADPTAADQGAHEITVTATDTDGLSTEVHFTIHVIDLAPVG